jgi:hypothetical protein
MAIVSGKALRRMVAIPFSFDDVQLYFSYEIV